MGRAPRSSDAPLWPDAEGNFVSKTVVIDTVLVLASMTCPGRNTEGRTGHTFRCTGAQLMAKAGIPPLRIQLFERWESSVVHRYIRDAGAELSDDLAALTFAKRTGPVSYTHLTLPTILLV
eukprot:1348884-Amphidinium_carterae.1